MDQAAQPGTIQQISCPAVIVSPLSATYVLSAA